MSLKDLSNEKLIELRKQLKRDEKRYHNMQWSKKIQLNSAYGAVGNPYFRFYNKAQAEAVTLSGQLAIRWVEREINLYFNKVFGTEDKNYIVFSHTDSVYIWFGPLVDAVFKDDQSDKIKITKYLNKVCETKIKKLIADSYDVLAKFVNAYEPRMHMKREAIADKAVFVAKNRYIMNVYDMEGVLKAEPAIKMVGVEAIKSSIPVECRKAIKKCLELAVRGTEQELNQYINDFKNSFDNLPVEDIALSTTINHLHDYIKPNDHGALTFESRAPQQVKAAAVFNHLISVKGLSDKYDVIKEGEKAKIINLYQPNEIMSDVIGFTQVFPDDIISRDYVDREAMFDKCFAIPVERVIKVMGWRMHARGSCDLDDILDFE